MTLNVNAQAGDESRRHGDYISLPDTEVEEDGTNAVGAGVPVTYNGTTISAATVDGAAGGESIVGILHTYQYFGDSSRDGPYIRTDQDPTIKTSGAVYADLSGISASPSAGDTLGPNGELLVLEDTQTSGVYEVLIR